jgi:hypothetical protein
MKKLGFLFILIGLVVGILLPLAQVKLSGTEITTLSFADFRNEGTETQNLLIRKEDNPVRINFRARYKVGAQLPPVKLPITVKISDADGTLIGTIISFKTDGFETGPEQPKVAGSQSLVFDVQNDGLHLVSMAFAPQPGNSNVLRPDVEEITAKFIANTSEQENPYRIPAAVLGILGFYLIVRSRRGQKREPKKHRWGRGGS